MIDESALCADTGVFEILESRPWRYHLPTNLVAVGHRGIKPSPLRASLILDGVPVRYDSVSVIDRNSISPWDADYWPVKESLKTGAEIILRNGEFCEYDNVDVAMTLHKRTMRQRIWITTHDNEANQ